MHCHHEKLVVIDGEIAFVGGIDLTDLGGDRCDTPAHPARGRLGWHDVASRLRGPAVADVAAPPRAALGRRSPGSALEPAGRAGERAGDVERAGRADRPGEALRLRAARRLPDPRGLHARAALGAAA